MIKALHTYVTIAPGFFSTAYTLTNLWELLAAARVALTNGPLPAPTTMITLKTRQIAHVHHMNIMYIPFNFIFEVVRYSIH